MKGTIYFNLAFLSIIAALLVLSVQVNKLINYQLPQFIGEVCSLEIKEAMNNMGPKYNYLMKGETLYVDKGDGKWLRLKYERSIR